MTLGDLQRQFLTTVVSRGQTVDGDPRGMRVHAKNYRGQLCEALRDTYERTAHWLGDHQFLAFARMHLARHPPSSWSLNRYGAEFPALLAEMMPHPSPGAELAWLDLALREAFDGAGGPVASLAAQTVGDWETVRFEFVPTLRFRALTTNAAAIWSALSGSADRPEPRALQAPVGVRVWRQDLTPRFVSMSAGEARCLEAAMGGATFGDLCAILSAHKSADGVIGEAGNLLRRWFDDGLVQSLKA